MNDSRSFATRIRQAPDKSSQPAVNPRKIAQQQRAQAAVDTLLEAAARILVREGYDALTTNRVAEVAGYSVGSLYQYFPNKAALITALWRKHHQELYDEYAATFEKVRPLPLRAAIRELVLANVRAHQIDPDLHRVLSTSAPEIDFGGPDKDGTAEMYTMVRAFFESRRHECRPGLDIDLAMVLIHKLGDNLTHAAVIDEPELLEKPAFVDELTTMIVAYLTTDGL